MSETASRWLSRYLAVRKPLEVAFWVLALGLAALADARIAAVDARRAALDVAAWEPVLWEATSHVATLVLVPLVIAYERRVPLRIATLPGALGHHAIASVLFSAAHVGLMVALRAAIYAAASRRYEFGPWLDGLGYEYLKDVRTYMAILLVVGSYRMLLLRLQGEASLLGLPDAGPSEGRIDRPERFLVKKLGKEFLLPAAEIERVSAMGNYVNLHVRGRDYPLRATMQSIEARLDARRFVRVHRGHIVNLDFVVQIEPTDSGDAQIVLKDGSRVPCSRRYRDALKAPGERVAEA